MMKLLLQIFCRTIAYIPFTVYKKLFPNPKSRKSKTMQISEFLRRQLNTPLVEGVGAGDALDLNITSVMFLDLLGCVSRADGNFVGTRRARRGEPPCEFFIE
jgi:hypothetical protein